MIRFACPSCSATFTVSDDKAGKSSTCPKCKVMFTVPDSGDEPSKLAPEPKASTVTIDPCPKCRTQLSVEPDDLGAHVECPTCGTNFTAKAEGSSNLAKTPSGPQSDSKRGDDFEFDRPSRRRRDEDEDEEDDDRPRKRRRRRSYQPHRGGLILTLGILSLVFCGIFTAIPAVIMGGSDLKEMDAGRMDPEGRGTTQAGRVIGWVSIGLTVVVVLFYCVIFAAVGVGAGAKGGR